MPIYEFACKDCGNRFEVLRLSSNGFKGVECPKCHGKKVAKEMSTFSPAIGGTSHASACDTGGCQMPHPSCSSGMCGMN
jgi:putative FmdB family regulatory protein